MKLLDLTREDFSSIWRIMEPSFPRDERRPRDEQLAIFDQPEYHAYGARDADGTLIGFLTTWNLDDVVFVEHFAVNPACRNGGVGSAMLSALIAQTNAPICLEVELPETEMARRRIAFYERNGLFYNEYPYVQPAMSKGQEAVPLRIMTSGGCVSKERFVAIRALLYERVYRVPVPECDWIDETNTRKEPK